MISVLIPAYNEADRITDTLKAVQSFTAEMHIQEIIVVDDGSTDDTSARAQAAGADVVFRQTNSGKGAALNRALALAQGNVLLLLDADLGASATEAIRLLGPVVSGAADMTIATFPRKPGTGGGVGLVVRLARWGIHRLTGQTMQAPLSGQRAVRRQVLEDMGGFAEGWGVEVALTVSALKNGYRVLEIPTQMSHRVTGRSPGAILHRARQFVAALRVLLRLGVLHPKSPSNPGMLPPTERHSG
jgi:glucosyl-3-phosphoglycerate synthase